MNSRSEDVVLATDEEIRVAMSEYAAGEAARQARIAAGIEDVCVVCGCSDTRACPGGCFWVAPGLCSRCAGSARNDYSGG